jgi:hypothetical protein
MSHEDKFWAVWKNPYLLMRIFEKNREGKNNANYPAKIGYLKAFQYCPNLIYSTEAMDWASENGRVSANA